jgi:hypothetical protein
LAYRFSKVNIFSSISILISNSLPSLSLCISIAGLSTLSKVEGYFEKVGGEC